MQQGCICPFLVMPRQPEPPWAVERMFDRAIAQCTRGLKNFETLLDKSEQHAALLIDA